MEIKIKIIKAITVGILSIVGYLLLDNWSELNKFLKIAETRNSASALSVYLLINLIKFFMGVTGLTILIVTPIIIFLKNRKIKNGT